MAAVKTSCSSTPTSTFIAINHSGRVQIQRSAFGMVKLKPIQILSHNRALNVLIRSSLRHQVFEDNLRGIVCYRDDQGDVICEGLDEGPALRQHRPSSSPQRRDAEIVEILQRNWLHIVESGVDKAKNTSSVQLLEDSNCNGYNTRCVDC